MDDNLAIFLIMAVAIAAAVALTSLTAFIRAKYRNGGLPTTLNLAGADGADSSPLLAAENSELRGQVNRLEHRLRVLEAIATDPAVRSDREIESLR
jgi:hypothetical protein